MRQKRFIGIAAISVAVAVSVAAAEQDRPLLNLVQRLSLPAELHRRAFYTANPAQMFYLDCTGISRVRADLDIRREQTPVMEQLGDGHTLAGIGAESYMRLSPESAVWGTADFVSGTYRNIRWTDCIDYLRVAPYVLGDEAGGNLSSRSYTFSGGYVRRRNRWTAGVEAEYRAEIAYRNRDPRVKTIVSDLYLRAGATFAVGNHAAGVSATLNIYSQSCDLDFYNPVNDINTYTLTGLGTFYRRFMGNTNKNSGYSSPGYALSAQWLPSGRTGLYAEAAFSACRMGQQLRNFNNITLGYTDNTDISVNVAYGLCITPDLFLYAGITGTVNRRRGTENLFGTSAGTSYDKIGSRTPYTAEAAAAELSLPLQLATGDGFITFEPCLKIDSSTEEYTDPRRRLKAGHTEPMLKVDYTSDAAGKWMWSIGAEGSRASASSEQPVLTDLDLSEPLGRSVMSNFDMLRADRLFFGASASVSRSCGNFVLTLSASYNHTSRRGKGNCDSSTLTLSAEF